MTLRTRRRLVALRSRNLPCESGSFFIAGLALLPSVVCPFSKRDCLPDL